MKHVAVSASLPFKGSVSNSVVLFKKAYFKWQGLRDWKKGESLEGKYQRQRETDIKSAGSLSEWL